jgi:hypothetical protein
LKAELDQALCHAYPSLYRDRHGDMRTTLMCWGFACGDGWYALIDTLSRLLSQHNRDIKAIQVKEKMGGLRFYCNPEDDYAFGIVQMAEHLSEATCEECGAPGALYTTDGWLSTRCPIHATPDNIAGESYELPVKRVSGIGMGWARLVTHLKEMTEWHTEHNGVPKATFNITKVNDCLKIQIIGGSDFTKGMVDLIIYYADQIDEDTGRVIEHAW